MTKEFDVLKGLTITEVLVEPNPEFGKMRPAITLMVEGKAGRYVVSVSADAEGNGPGWLHLVRVGQ